MGECLVMGECLSVSRLHHFHQMNMLADSGMQGSVHACTRI